KGVQAIPITWTTPPGSSPFIQYKLKIVEMVTPRNPNDAIQSTRAHYEETLNSNMLLYGPQYPALIPGRQYAMVVQAMDPTGMSKFRNRGLSEVVSFIYGKEDGGIAGGSGDGQSGTQESAQLTRKYATNIIQGKLVWAFKKSEEPSSGRATNITTAGKVGGVAERANANAQKVEAVQTVNTSTSNGGKVSNALSTYYLSHNALQSNNATANAKQDPTLNMTA